MMLWIIAPTFGSSARRGSIAPANGVVPTPSVCTPILASVFGMFMNRPKMPIEPVIVVGSAKIWSPFIEIQ